MPAVSSAICLGELLLAGVLWDEAELALSPVPYAFGWRFVVKIMQWRQLLMPYVWLKN
jgi:hypothetical protein